MINFEFSLPTVIKFGQETHLEVGKLVGTLGKKVLIHYGSNRIKKNGLLNQIVKSLEATGITFVEFGGVKSNPSVETAREAVLLCKKEKVDCILAVGGGSVVDSAKAIALGACSDEDLWDIYSGKKAPAEKALPLGVIITIPATGSEVNAVTVLSNYQLQDKRAIANSLCIPKFAILNPELTLSIPAYDTAVATVDIFSHCFERYVDLRRVNRLWDELCEGTMRTVVDIGPKLIYNLKDYEMRSELMWCATVAHSNMLGPGGDFACHGLAHVLTIKYGISHGGALALVMPAWCEYMYSKAPERFNQFGQTVWNTKNGKGGIEEMRLWIQSLGLPTRLSDVEISEFRPDELAERAFAHGELYLGGGLERTSVSDAKEIYRLLW